MLFLPVQLLRKRKTQWFCPGRTDGVVLPPGAVMRDWESSILIKEKKYNSVFYRARHFLLFWDWD